jgi:hypothetical protein
MAMRTCGTASSRQARIELERGGKKKLAAVVFPLAPLRDAPKVANQARADWQ